MKQILSLSFAMILVSIAGYGFAGNQDNIKVHLSAAAHIGETKLPAGDYTIQSISTSSGLPVLEVQSEGGVHVLVMANRNYTNVSDKTNVILTSDGADFRISSIHLAGRSYSYDVTSSATPSK